MTLFPDPVPATATKRPPPYVTDRQSLSAAEALIVHVTPSGDVMTLFPDPELAIATKRPPPYVTEVQ
jgi:hypothetical protein